MSGPTRAYLTGTRSVGFHFCADCGCMASWRAVEAGPDGRRRMAVNIRLADPASVAAIPLDPFDGLTTWEDLPRDGRCVADVSF